MKCSIPLLYAIQSQIIRLTSLGCSSLIKDSVSAKTIPNCDHQQSTPILLRVQSRYLCCESKQRLFPVKSLRYCPQKDGSHLTQSISFPTYRPFPSIVRIYPVFMVSLPLVSPYCLPYQQKTVSFMHRNEPAVRTRTSDPRTLQYRTAEHPG